MSRSSINPALIIKMGKREGMITQGLIALWTGRYGSTAYLIFKQLKEQCQMGYLDDDDYICIADSDKIVFKKSQGTKLSLSDDKMKILKAVPEGGDSNE
ncbi:MAG: hypothetical protein QXZ63_07540 [Sulfolobales archaeon]